MPVVVVHGRVAVIAKIIVITFSQTGNIIFCVLSKDKRDGDNLNYKILQPETKSTTTGYIKIDLDWILNPWICICGF
jgi:hypothetical protein